MNELIGKTLLSVSFYDGIGDFYTADHQHWRMDHDQDCCESVSIREVCGDVANIIGSPLIVAEEIESAGDIEEIDKSAESFTWTYYRFVTSKGELIVKWYGESNGYYSETPYFKRVEL